MNRSNIARSVVLTAATLSVLGAAVAAFPRPTYPPVLKKVYPNASGIGCASCHIDGKPPALKKYGESVKTELVAAKTKMLTEDMILKLEKKGIRPEGVSAPKKDTPKP